MHETILVFIQFRQNKKQKFLVLFSIVHKRTEVEKTIAFFYRLVCLEFKTKSSVQFVMILLMLIWMIFYNRNAKLYKNAQIDNNFTWGIFSHNSCHKHHSKGKLFLHFVKTNWSKVTGSHFKPVLVTTNSVGSRTTSGEPSRRCFLNFFLHTDSTKINRPGHNIRMYWTNFRQPTAHVQQNIFRKTF